MDPGGLGGGWIERDIGEEAIGFVFTYECIILLFTSGKYK